MERPRLDRLKAASIVLAAIGALDSLYLWYVKASNAQAAFCSVGGGCDTVNNSLYSEIAGVPVAALGLGVYLLMVAIPLLEGRWTLATENGPLALFGLSLTGTLYSAYLTYLEVAVIHAICPYCVISALVMLALLAVSAARLRQQNME